MSIIPRSQSRALGETLRAQGKKIVFTNGCFDLIHRGHVQYLADARALGDVLIVGVNGDASVKRLKGDGRPLVAEADRMFVLSNLKPVDYVVAFEEDTPLQLIAEILPDVLVKGGDWEITNIVGSEIVIGRGGTVKSLRFVEGFSTTSLLERIRNLA